MSIEINTFEATYNKPLDGGAFITAAGKAADDALAKRLRRFAFTKVSARGSSKSAMQSRRVLLHGTMCRGLVFS